MYEITSQDKVLFVDDEENVLRSIKRSLISAKFEVLTATGGAEALKILEQESIAVMVTDLKMPGMNGIDLIKLVGEKYPDVVKIVLSAYYQMSTVLSVIRSGEVFYFFTKPWKMDDDFLPILEKAIIHFKENREGSVMYRLSEAKISELEGDIKDIRSQYNSLKLANQNSLSVLKYTLESFKQCVREINELITDEAKDKELTRIRNEALEAIKNIHVNMFKNR